MKNTLRLLIVALSLCANIAVAAVFALPWGPRPQFLDANGAPMTSGKLYFYVAGSTTAVDTYTTQTGGVKNSNPITLNTRGETTTEVWLTGGVSYKMELRDSSGATVWTVDSISGVNDTTGSQSEWIAGPAPTYVSAVQFTLSGDQTATFNVGRRVKSTNSGGTAYSLITVSTFAVNTTTVTVVNDSTTLDAGLSAVSYALLSASNPSVPRLGLLTNSLSGNVALNNTANYFDGPSVAQGSAGTWLATGGVCFRDTAGAAAFGAKLWDGTTVIASAEATVTALNVETCIHLSGVLTAPAGNLRISGRDATSTSGLMFFNASGFSKDGTITAIRIQ